VINFIRQGLSKVREEGMKDYTVSKEYLEKVVDLCSRTLVGKVMKRFELFSDQEVLKKDIKELIYENYRSLKELIESFNSGIKFKTKPRENR
jgi:hypothetical protein